jgi:hypothetical protein
MCCGELGCLEICEKDCDNNLTKEQIDEELKKVDKELEELKEEK